MLKEKESKLKSKKFNVSLLIIVPLLVVSLFFCAYGFISVQVEIAKKNDELNAVTKQRIELENENLALQRYSQDEYKNEYMESIARNKLGYALPEERIYYIMPSD